MAKLDFPSSDQSPWTNPDTGVTYVWKGGSQGAWHIASASDTDIFVVKTGDKMTGDLTLGPDGDTNITLNATNGNVRLTSDALIQGSATAGDQQIASLRLSTIPNSYRGGSFEARPTNPGVGVYDLFFTQSIGASNPVDIACFEKGSFFLGGTLKSNPNIQLKADGSASFAGNVDIGEVNGANLNIYQFDGTQNNNGIQINSSGFSSVLTIQNKTLVPNDTEIFKIMRGVNVTAFITPTGNATFGPSVTTDNLNVQNIITNSTGSVGLRFGGGYQAINPLNGVASLTDNYVDLGSTGYRYRALYAVSTRSAGVFIDLEPDNDDNYTTTTEEYTETESYTGPLGNTLEREVTKTRDVRTYTGPTLDVKDRLQNLIARLDSLEAEELADDATSTLLLTTVNNLNADMTKTKAALTAIRTAANAAGTLEQLKADIATATADI